MGLTRDLLLVLFVLASGVAFARGALRDAADVWSGTPKTETRAKSVLEKGYAPKKTAAAKDDSVLGLLLAEAESVRPAVTNAPTRIVAPAVERPVTNVVEIEKIVTVERPVTNTVEIERIVTVEKPVTNTVEVVKIERVEVEKPVEVVVERPVTNVVEKIVEVEKKVVVERTNVVEKVVFDRSVEMRLSKDKAELERRGEMLEVRNAGLEKRNDELKRELDEERRRRERLERALPGAKKTDGAAKKTGRPAHITSAATYYDRKRGVAKFEGRVHVDDESYQLHADEAYVFMSGTNDVRRIVAIGNVAMTNETRRVYGDKVSYYRQDGMVVLYANDGNVAEIRDESKAEDQTVRGSRIKFWIDNQQVEVLDATISAPREGAGMGNVLGK